MIFDLLQDKYESLSEEFHDFQVSSKEIEQVRRLFILTELIFVPDSFEFQ